VKYILDTCALIWFATDHVKLSQTVSEIIDDPNSDGHVSIISFWEISIKSVAGKLDIPFSPSILAKRTEGNGIKVLPLALSHIDRFQSLPRNH
jgi:PIN domain nuclease of toxin-antitoxin system